MPQPPELERSVRRYQLVCAVLFALALFYAFRVWQDRRHAAARHVDSSMLPYLGLLTTVPVALLLLAAVIARRVAPRSRVTQLLQELAAYAAPIGLFIGAGLLMPTIL
jgi:fumarate reductase subunit C